MKKKLIMGMILTFSPILAFAQASSVSPVASTCAEAKNAGTLESLLCRIGGLLNTLIPFLIVLGVVYFVWGVITYVIASDEEAKSSGRSRMIYGIIGLVVIVGMWGLVNIVTRTFQIDRVVPITVPCIQGTPGC